MRQPISNFWWGVEDGKKKLHWRSWSWLSTPKSLGGMGFRDLATFNQAMLGKQGWRLMTDPNSLCARVLKGRYFPNGDFWRAQCPRSSSYTWRSIMHGKKLLDRGILWRVGDGKQINILRDRWIPEVVPGTMPTSPSIGDNQTVNTLMRANEGQWNEAAIRKYFSDDIAERILSIPLSTEGCSDFPSWPHSKTGVYTVRSAYNLARTCTFWSERSCSGKGSSSNHENMEKAWKKLWAIQCPNKMKVTLWRMAHNCLPTGSQLQMRSIPTRYDCYFCNREEQVEHCFLQCQYVKEIWKQLTNEFGICLNLKSFINVRQWLLDWISKASDFHSIILAVAIWHIWENRNNTRNGEVILHPLRVVGKIRAYIEFISLHSVNPSVSNRRETLPSTQKWSPPPEGVLLINVDAAIFSKSGQAGFGVVVRDHRGMLLAASRGALQHVHAPEVAEALAMRQALVFSRNAGFQKIQVASDCLSLINRVQDDGFDRSPIGAIVKEIKTRATMFLSCIFIHVRRCCNVAAHALAKSAEHDVGSCWFSEVPAVIIRTIICTEQIMNE
jgi:hypothetical protein